MKWLGALVVGGSTVGLLLCASLLPSFDRIGFNLSAIASNVPVFFPRRSFNTGIITLDIGGRNNGIRAGFRTADYKLVVVGYASNATHNDVALARYWPDGSLDTSFDGDGIVQTALGFDVVAHAGVMDASGRYVVAGRGVGTDNDFIVLRYDTDGTLDNSFNTNGRRLIDFGADESARGVAIDGNGDILLAGFIASNGNFDFAVARVNSDGSIDSGFDSDGLNTTDFPTGHNDAAYAILIDSNDEVWLGGRSVDDDAGGADNDFAIARYGTDGVLIGTNSTDSPGGAAAEVDDLAWAMAFDSNAYINLVGRVRTGANYAIGVVRYTPTGVYDTDFSIANGNGIIGRSLAVTTRGRFMYAGRSYDGSSWNFAVGKTLSDGTADSGFGALGIALTTITAADDVGLAIVFTNQNVYVVGNTDNGTDTDFAIVRYNSNGTVALSGDQDRNLNTIGERNIDFATDNDRGWDMAKDSNGNYLMAGWVEPAAGAADDRDFAVLRLLPSGATDSSFDTDGWAVTELNSLDRNYAQALVVDSSDRPIAGGRTENGNAATRDMAIVRYNTDGSLDSTWSSDGIFQDDFCACGDEDQIWDMAIDASGRILAAGLQENGAGNTEDMGVIRLTTAGVLDTTFDTDGRAVTDFTNQTQARRMALSTSGKIYLVGFSEVGGTSNNFRDFAVARLNSNGSIDSSFDSDGLVTTAIDTTEDRAYGVTEAPDGKLYVVGYTSQATLNAVIARYLTDGSLDTSWDTDGISLHDAAAGGDQIYYDVKVTPNGKIIAVGIDRNNYFGIRYLSDGTQDASMDGDGKFRYGIGGTDEPYRLILEEDGRITLGGRAGNDFAIMRVWP